MMPRIPCPLCGRDVPVTPTGNVRTHKHPTHSWACWAGTMTPAAAAQMAEQWKDER